MTTRRDQIEAMLRAEPDDPFLLYARAVELAKEGQAAESQLELRRLTQRQPPYVAAFFLGARQLVEQEQFDDARRWLRDGIEAARHAGDLHAAGEMSELLASIGSS